MTDDAPPPAEPEPVRLVVLGDAAAAPVCEEGVCRLPPTVPQTPPPESPDSHQ